MFFKNLHLLKITAPFQHSAGEIQSSLSAFAFVPCGATDARSQGWVSPVGRKGDNALLRCVSSCFVVSARVEEKIVPGSVIREKTSERIDQIESTDARKVGRKEKKEIAEEVRQELLPHAFKKTRSTYACIDPVSGFVMIDAASARKAEDIVELLVKTFPDLQISLVRVQDRPSGDMTQWVQSGDAPAGFSIDMECSLVDASREGASVKCKKQNLDTDEIRRHIESGKEVVKLAMTWSDKMSFNVSESLDIGRLAFLDIVTEKAEDSRPETEDEQFDADAAIMIGEFREFAPDLLWAFGGEARTE